MPKTRLISSAILMAAAIIFSSLSTAGAEPWFNIVDGRVIYTREHRPGLPEDYGQVGKNGLVWYAGFDGSLKASYINSENPEEALTYEAELAEALFVDGVLGKALYVPQAEGTIGATFREFDTFTPLERGSLILWMKSDEGSLFRNTFDIFRSGASGMRHRTHAPHHLALQWRAPGGYQSPNTNSYLVAPLTNDLSGWNMYAYTWDTTAIKFYANGFFVEELAIPVGTYNWGHFEIGTRANQSPRAYDEISFYNRVLSQGEINRLYLGLLKPIYRQTVTIPRTASPVRIDGVIDEQEWKGSVSVRGFLEGSPAGDFGTGQISDPQNALFLQYDDKHLYVAVNSPWPEDILDARAITTALTGTVRSVAVEGQQVDPAVEDAFEILISNPEVNNGGIYRLLINSNNVISDGVISGRSAEQQTNFSWNSGWDVVTRDAVEGEWLLEAAIPLADLGIDDDAGGVLNFNVARHWNIMKRGSEAWQWGRREDDPSSRAHGNTFCITDSTEVIPLGTLKLSGPSAPVASILSVGELLRGELDFAVELFNPGRRAVAIDVSLRTSTVEEGRYAPTFLLTEEKVSVAPGERAVFTYMRQLEDYGDNMLIFRAESGNDTIMENIWHFIREETLDIYVKKFPTAGKVAALINCGLLADYSPSELRARMQIRDGDGNVHASALSEPFSTYTELVSLGVEETVPGEYVLAVDIISGGSVVASQEQSYTKNPLPHWLGNEYGWNFDTVPEPFTPVEREGNTLSAWHREYDFGGGLFPAAITTQGWELLREPVNLIITLADGTVIETNGLESEIIWDDFPSVTVVRQIDGRLAEVEKEMSGQLRREGRAHALGPQGIRVTNNFFFEYDGLLWNSVTIEAEADIEIKEMAIEIAMTEFFSKDIYPGFLIPQEGLSRVIQWIGNGYGGLQPIVRTAPAGSISGYIRTSDEGVVYRITLVEGLTALSDMKPLEFSLQATPVKARYPEYRRLNWGMEGSKIFFDIAGTYPRDQFFVPATDGWHRNLIYTPGDEDPIMFRNNKRWYEGYHDFDPQPTVYAAPYFFPALNINVPEADDFKDEWLSSPRGDERLSAGTMAIRRPSATLSVRDYYLWRYGQLMERVPFGAVYSDGTVGHRVSPSHPILHNAPGEKHPILGAREIVQRMYTLVKIPFPDGITYDHTPGTVDAALKAFKNFEGDGEQDWPLHYEGMENFEGVMPLEKYRTKYMGHNHGWVGNWIPKLGNKSFLTRQAQRKTGAARPLAEHGQSIKLLHDSSTHIWRYDFVGEYSTRLGNALKKHGWGDDYLTIAYWDQQIAQLPENMYASFYVLPAAGGPAPETFDTAGYYLRTMEGAAADKVICIFANESDWEGEVRVKPDWEKLGFSSPEELKVENAVHRLKVNYTNPEYINSNDVRLPEDWYEFVDDPDEYARIEGDEIVFPMTRWNYRMIVIERE